MKRWLICVCMMLAVVLLATPAQAEEFSGTCGENLTWNFDQSTGTLTISGEGAMEDYPFSALEEYKAPWYTFRDMIKTVVIEPGVTDIGDCAFLENPTMTSLTIPDTVTEIGSGAFSDCTALKSLYIPDSVTHIRGFAFSACTALEEIRLPATLESFAEAFTGCTALQTIVFPEG